MKCPQCKRKFTPDAKHPHQKFCSQECGIRYRRGMPKTTPPVGKCEQYCKEADECKLDYGTYRALREQGKSFEEIKARGYSLQCHSHVKKSGNHCD